MIFWLVLDTRRIENATRRQFRHETPVRPKSFSPAYTPTFRFVSHSIHVANVGLDRAFDRDVWNYARQHNCLIVTKDVDFSELSLLHGFPPKVIWIRRGNCSTNDIETLLRKNYVAVKAMNDSDDAGILELF